MRRIAIKCTLVLALFFITLYSSAQHPPYPNNGSNPGSGNTPVGGGAPIEGGLLILVVLSAGYGCKKIYQGRKNLMD